MAGQAYDNTNRGVLFENDRKSNDKQPDMTGKLNINGTDYFISGWWKEGQKGRYLSLAKQNRDADGKPGPRQGGNQRPASRPAEPEQQSFKDDDIPF